MVCRRRNEKGGGEKPFSTMRHERGSLDSILEIASRSITQVKTHPDIDWKKKVQNYQFESSQMNSHFYTVLCTVID
jgi:hypothetical protein